MKRYPLNVCAGVALAATLAVAACSSDTPATAPSAIPSYAVATGNPDLAVCKTKTSASVSARIGTSGGTLTMNGHTLVIPKNAVNGNVTITMSQVKGVNSQVDLQPEGLQFAVPASLTLDYSDCTIQPTLAFVAYLHPDGYLEPLPSLDDRLKLKVTTPLQHFSKYAVAW